MEDPVIVTLLIRGGLAAFLAVVGAWCVHLGYKLLFTKAPHKSKSAFEATIGGHKVSFSAGTAGTAVVFTSAIWVVGAVLTVPALEQPGGTTVAFGPAIVHSTGVERVAALQFKGDRVSLTVAQKKALETFASQIAATATKPRIVVEGYADVDQSELNSTVAEQRAEAVRDYMVKIQQIDASRILTLSYGESMLGIEVSKNAVVLTATKRLEDG